MYYDSVCVFCFFFFSSRRRHTRFDCDWSSDVCSSDLRVPSRGVPQRVGRKARRPPPRGSSPRPLRRRRRATSRAPSRSATRRNSGPRPSQNSSGASRSQSSPVRRARPWFSTVGRVSFPSLSSSGARAVRLQLGLSAVLIPCALAAQTPAAVQRAANAITPAGVRHHVGVLADDSMLGRATPSPQLEQTARYVAEQFRRFGLKPAGDTRYLQRYTVAQRGVDTQVSVIRIARGAPAAGAFEIRDATAAAALGIDPPALRARTGGWTARGLPAVTITYLAKERELGRASAPNVIGVLEGSDPKLKSEYVFFTGHMDHIGTPGAGEGWVAKGADSICNGADDDASGTTAVLEAAEAFSKLVPHPKRSLAFMTVSGEERGLWGSQFFSEHPTVPLAKVVADLNSDMVGRNWKDTIVVIGKEHSNLGATLNRVAAAHPELRMTAIDDIWPQERFYFRSDHYNFARKGVPILFFFNGTHADYHQVGDSPDKIDAEKESRIVTLLFYLGLDVANAAERPKWNPESYKQIVAGAN